MIEWSMWLSGSLTAWRCCYYLYKLTVFNTKCDLVEERWVRDKTDWTHVTAVIRSTNVEFDTVENHQRADRVYLTYHVRSYVSDKYLVWTYTATIQEPAYSSSRIDRVHRYTTNIDIGCARSDLTCNRRGDRHTVRGMEESTAYDTTHSS